MSEIPEDVWGAAYTVFNNTVITPGVIARAILAERKRCAEIANSRGSPGHFMNVRRDISNAINSGEQP